LLRMIPNLNGCGTAVLSSWAVSGSVATLRVSRPSS